MYTCDGMWGLGGWGDQVIVRSTRSVTGTRVPANPYPSQARDAPFIGSRGGVVGGLGLGSVSGASPHSQRGVSVAGRGGIAPGRGGITAGEAVGSPDLSSTVAASASTDFARGQRGSVSFSGCTAMSRDASGIRC
eukprot:5591015-Karenia_brevis.AAC.1